MKKYLIIFIVLLGGIIRLWNLTNIPPSLNSDEAAIGYNAYSILETSRDEYGTPYPLTFRSFDDYKMPLYVYFVAFSMKLWGFGDFAVRFPSALMGTITIFLTFLLAKKLYDENVGTIAALLLAISPWHIYFSRSGYEANAAVLFIVLGMYLFLQRNFIASSLFFSLSIWTYLTPRIFVPLFVIGLAIIYRKDLIKRKTLVIAGVCLAVLLLVPIIRMTISAEGQMRAQGVSAFANPDDLKKSVTRLVTDTSPLRIFDNRRITYAITFLRGYFTHFDPNFLFLDKSIDKYRAPDSGLLYIFELPLVLTGMYFIILRWSTSSAFLFWWLLVSPVAAAFTLQLPHPVRTLVFLPVFQIIAGVGFLKIWISFKKIRLLYIGIIVVSFLYFLHHYFVLLPRENAPYWYWGRKEMTNKIAQLENEYDAIFVSNSLEVPYIFYLYYRPINPSEYIAQGGTISGGFDEQRNFVKNIRFRSIDSSLRDPLKKSLFVGLPSEVFAKSLIVDTIYYPDGSPAIVFFN